MSLDLYSCEACGLSQLTQSGFNLHLRQKHNNFCRVYYQNKENMMLDDSKSDHEDSPGSFKLDDPNEEPESAIPFQQDTLGIEMDYEHDNFGQTNAEGLGRNQVENSDDDNNDFAAAAEMENNWEPPRPQEDPDLDLKTDLDLHELPEDGLQPNNPRLEAEKLANTSHP